MAQNFDTSDAPHITVAHCGGSLSLVGTDPRGMTVLGDENQIKVERQGESFTVTANGDCDIHCPPGTSVTIKQVNGDLSVLGLSGPLAIESASRDVTLRDIGPTTLRQAHGDLQVRGVKGELKVESVSGDAQVRQVAGAVELKSVRGDLAARDLDGGAVVEHVSGDVSLSTALAKGAAYRFQASGDISAKVDVGSGARLTLQGSEVHCRLPLQTTERTTGRVVGTLGDGSAELTLQASGDLSVTERGETWGWAGEEQWESAMGSWSLQFEAQMADMQRKLEERLAGIPYVDGEKVARRAQEAAERARRQAQRTAERAQARAERAARRLARSKVAKHEAHGHGMRWSWSAPQPPKPPAEPVSDTERMAILKMVADKKITADEASRLLAALEGEA
jgi:hypothetical protein